MNHIIFNTVFNFLNEEESFHCIKVLRHHEGDEIKIADGKGNLFSAEIISADKRKCEIKILETIYHPQFFSST